MSTLQIPFRYIAPGIRVPTVAEFTSQPYLGSYPTKYPESLSLLLFTTDGKNGIGRGIHPLTPPTQPSSTPKIANIPVFLYTSAMIPGRTMFLKWMFPPFTF
jgi:hypothetical protein